MPIPNTPYLVRVNGVPIWCASTSNPGWTVDQGIQNANTRQADGSLLADALYYKRTLDCKTIPYTSEDAYSLAMLVTGKGIVLPFDATSFASSKGTLPSSGGGTYVAGYNSSGPIANAVKYGAGALSLAAGQTLAYSNLLNVIGSTMGITVNLWTLLPAGATQFIDVSPLDVVLACGSSPAAGITLAYGLNSLSTPALTWLSGWNMITAVVRNPGGANPTAVVYFNGANVASGGPVNGSYLGAALNTITLGGTGTCSLDDVTVMPYPLNDAMVASIYQQQQPMGGLPQVYVDGDGVREAITATGRVSSSSYTLGRDAMGNFTTVARMLDLTLQEV